MLEKMGWSKGKGLGKKESGIIEPIKVTHKNDFKGIGYNDNTENWTPHQDCFNDLLSKLNLIHADERSTQDSGHSRPIKDFSLEFRSKTSRSKVHYQKLIRVKDASQYSKEDWDGIFGTKSSASCGMEKQHLKPNEIGKNNSDLNNFNEIPTIQSGKSMSDYFSEKMKNKGAHLIKQECSREKATINGCKVLENDEVDQSDDSPPQEEPIVVKKKKKTKKNSEEFKTSHMRTDRSALVFEYELSETASEDPNSRTLKSQDKVNGVDSSLPKSQKSLILQKRKWDSHSNSGAQEINCIMINGNSVDNETVVAVKKKKKKKCLKFSEIGDSDANHSGVVCRELISDISLKANNLELETDVVYLNEQCDTKSIVKESSLKFNGSAPSKKRKHVSSSNSTNPSQKNQTKTDTFKKCITSGLKSCLKNNIISDLKKVKKMVTFRGKPLVFEVKSSEESDSSSISELENVSSDEDVDDELSKKAAESDTCATQLPKSDTQDGSISLVKKLEGDTNNSATFDSENALMAYHFSTVKQNIWVNNESWAVSQRLAMNLSHYKNIIKGIKNDKILATTNLLDMKGYGNW